MSETPAAAPRSDRRGPPKTDSETLDTRHKAFQINLDDTVFGTFAEIGAGQEVARWFFLAGGAAGTVAKSISAYDMRVSDAIYGPTRRYVSRERLQVMLDYEYQLLLERLDGSRGGRTRFFVLADTVMASSYTRPDNPNGWLGVRFQREPREEPCEVVVHVNLRDRENRQQQQALGVLGVNLIYGAFYLHDSPLELIDSLMDDLSSERIEIDLIKLSGPGFAGVDNRLLNLQLVQQGIADATLFTVDGEVVQASEVLYKRPVLVERGRFRPVTHATRDMLESALSAFVQEPAVEPRDVVVLMEMTLQDLTLEAGIDHHDFLARVDMIGALGKMVLISNYFEYYRLASYLFRSSPSRVGVVMGLPSLVELFDEKYYTHLEGGILESFGRMFRHDLRLYVYPSRDPRTGALATVESLEVARRLRHLYAHLTENRHLVGLRDLHEEYLAMFPDQVLEKIQAGDESWKAMVPEEVARAIQQRGLWGYAPPGQRGARG